MSLYTDHLKEYGYCSFSNTILLWGIRDCHFMHNTITTTKFSYGLIDKFRTIITAEAANFLSRLSLKYYQNITDSSTGFVFIT